MKELIGDTRLVTGFVIPFRFREVGNLNVRSFYVVHVKILFSFFIKNLIKIPLSFAR